MKARLRMFILGSVGLCATVSAGAQGRAEGAIVIRDGAPVYIKSEGSAIQDTRVRGDFVAGATTLGITIQSYQFEEENGRVHVDYFRDKDQKGMARLGWMDPADLSRFTYECGCGSRHKPCSPFSEQGFLMRWNTCYLEAKDRKASELGKPAAESAGPPAKPEDNKPKSNEKPLTNADVLAMSKAGLGDELIVSKIQQAPSNFDTSPDALIRLKKAGVSNAILDAMV